MADCYVSVDGGAVELLCKVRRDAPNAYIFVMEPPIVDDDTAKDRVAP